MSTVANVKSPEVAKNIERFLQSDALKIFDGQQWRDAEGGQTFKTLSPASGATLAQVADAQKSDVDKAVKASQKAFEESGWAEMPANDRAAILHRFADLIEAHAETIAYLDASDTGKPITHTKAMDIPLAVQAYRYYADLVTQVRRREPIGLPNLEAWRVRHPAGVCAFIVPWNFPFPLAAWGAAPALAAGNTVVVKPAEDTPLSTLYLPKLAQEAGIPAGVFQVVPGTGQVAGSALANHPGIKRMGFTGSPEVGKLVAEACGRNLVPAKMELGGKGAAVVFNDVDVKEVAQGLAQAITLHCGQVCCTATRWVIHEEIWDQFMDEVGKAIQAVRIGNSLDDTTEMGPVVSDKQKKRVLGYLAKAQEQGARMLVEGGDTSIPGYEGGFYLKPAILTGDADNVAAREEIFGPVAYAIPFGEEREAIRMVNSSPYGLANSVWTPDLERAQRVAEALEAGNGWINAHNVLAVGLPYGGVNLSGFGGGVLGPDTLHDYFRMETVARPLA